MINVFPFADAAAIVRAHQKDLYYETYLHRLLVETVQVFKGQRYLIRHQDSILSIGAFLYLALTTLRNTRTLGEEYVDVIYTSRNGRKLPSKWRKVGFVVSYSVIPWLIAKLTSKLRSLIDHAETGNGPESFKKRVMLKLHGIVPLLTRAMLLPEVNLAVFYIVGTYYHLSKRVFGLRYALGHLDSGPHSSSTGLFFRKPGVGYEILGVLMFLKIASTCAGDISKYLNERLVNYIGLASSTEKNQPSNLSMDSYYVYDLKSALASGNQHDIDLTNPNKLPYLSGTSRKCMLCLSHMLNPTSLPCGHICCWNCIIDWCKDHNDCPLCRNPINQQLIPLQ